MVYGGDRSRRREGKRGVEDKYRGPLVKTVMTRCIHCTRCIRFASEVAGAGIRGTSGRGTQTEVGTYVDAVLKTERSGNLVDLCPVGALTSKPYAFRARPWELVSVDTVETGDARGQRVRRQRRGEDVRRKRPRDGEWRGDKSRFGVDGRASQRVRKAYVANRPVHIKDGQQERKTDRAQATSVIVHVGGHVDQATAKARVSRTQAQPDKRARTSPARGTRGHGTRRRHQGETCTPFGSRKARDAGVRRVGRDRRTERPVANTWRREAYRRNPTRSIWSRGSTVDLTYPVKSAGRTRTDRRATTDGRTRVAKDRRAGATPGRVRVGPSMWQARPRQARRTRVGHGATVARVHTEANTQGRRARGVPGTMGMVGTVESRKTGTSRERRVGVDAGDREERGYVESTQSRPRWRVVSHGDERTNGARGVRPRARGPREMQTRVTGEGRRARTAPNVTELAQDVVRVSEISDNSKLNGVVKATRGAESREAGWTTRTAPRVHDYHREGHPVSRASAVMARCARERTRDNVR
jgi:hypothetical protein